MASKRRIRRKSCQGKIGYDDVVKAKTALHFTSAKKYTGHMNVYRCKFCKKYHIGHSAKRR